MKESEYLLALLAAKGHYLDITSGSATTEQKDDSLQHLRHLLSNRETLITEYDIDSFEDSSAEELNSYYENLLFLLTEQWH